LADIIKRALDRFEAFPLKRVEINKVKGEALWLCCVLKLLGHGKVQGAMS
jgi:hypothetical protein